MHVSTGHSLQDETVASVSFFKFYITDIMNFEMFWLHEETGILTVSQTLIKGKTFANASIFLEEEFDEPLL